MTDIAEGRDIAVGIDPNGRWLLPLAWAADEAHRRNVRLRLVLALPSPHDTERVVDDTAQHNAVRHASSEALEEAAVWARERHPGTELATVLRDGYPAPVLCGTSRHARMVVLGSQAADHALALVVGRRGRGGYTGIRLGSVVHGLLHRAHCPAVTVPSR